MHVCLWCCCGITVQFELCNLLLDVLVCLRLCVRVGHVRMNVCVCVLCVCARQGEHKVVDGIAHCLEYLRLCVQYPTHLRMVKGHVHKLCGPWLAEHTDLRAAINKGDLDIHVGAGSSAATLAFVGTALWAGWAERVVWWRMVFVCGA